MSKNIIIAAGGTGGHISPGMALAEYLHLHKNEFEIENVYIHSLVRNKDNPDLKDSPFPILWHNLPQFNKLFPFYIFHYFLTILKTFITFKNLKIDSVIAMGGYSSFPSLLYALFFKKEIYLCEQNRIVGNVTKRFSKYAKKIAYSFPPVNVPESILLKSKIVGNPLRLKVHPEKKIIQSKLTLVPKKEKINVLVLGGSQGARQVNNMVLSVLENPDIVTNYNFRILTGTNLYDETKEKSGSDVDLISYSNDMKSHYEWANLVIARSGAGVISECVAFGLPMILIPYPFAKDNHQMENAKYLEEKDAAKVLYQRNEDNTKLINLLLEFSINRNKLLEQAEKSYKCSKINATKDVLNYFFKE